MVTTVLPTSIKLVRGIKRFPIIAFVAAAAASFALMLSHSLAAETLPAGDEAKRWDEIASVRFQAARGHDYQSDVRKEGALRPRGSRLVMSSILPLMKSIWLPKTTRQQRKIGKKPRRVLERQGT